MPGSEARGVFEGTGQRLYPTSSSRTAAWYREESKDMEATIRAGKLDGRRRTRRLDERLNFPPRGYSSVGRAPGSQSGGRRFEPA